MDIERIGHEEVRSFDVWDGRAIRDAEPGVANGPYPLIVWSPDGTHIIIAGFGITEPVIKRVWLSTDDLFAHAYECCITRSLSREERAQFGLPPRQG